MFLKPKSKVPRIVTDFDGIFSKDMIYNVNEKVAKSFGFGVRYSFELLKQAGFEPPVIITGDTSPSGKEISKKFLENIPHELVYVQSTKKSGYVRRRFKDDTYIWIGDDIYDLDLIKSSQHYVTVKDNPVLSGYATISFPQQYFWISFSEWLIRRYTNMSVMEIQRYINQPPLHVAIHEEIRQILIDNPIVCAKLYSIDTEDVTEYQKLLTNILSEYPAQNLSQTKPNFRLCIDMIPDDFIKSGDLSTVIKTFVVIKNPTKPFIRELENISSNYHGYQKIEKNISFYYDNSLAAATIESTLSKSIYRTVVPKLIDDNSFMDYKDTYSKNLEQSTIQMKLFI